MTKLFIDQLIQNMKKANIVTKASPWMIEGISDKQMNVRFVGIKPKDEWLNILEGENNLLIKFIIDRSIGFIEFYLANKPPFIKIISKYIRENDKWEVLLGEIRRRLNKDKAEYKSGNFSVGNKFALIEPHLKEY